jgi:tetratricopeptide (TPR) repeat protein
MENNAPSSEMVHRAIQAARSGRRLEARDLLLKVVESDPHNETAWLWLSGLVDSPEDRIIACENVLTINPANEKVRAYLAKLQGQQNSLLARKNVDDAAGLLAQARTHAERNEIDSALWLARQAVEKQESFEDAWLFIARISRDVNEQIAVLEKALKLNPANTKTTSTLKEMQYLTTHPMDAAARLEEMGKIEEALKVYEVQAATAKDLSAFDHIQKQILRIQRLRGEKILHVPPASSIARLTLAWPLVYVSLVLIQTGLNPIKHPNFYLWLALPLVIMGGFMLSLAEVRSHHMVWQKLFHEQGTGSTFARAVIAITGWFLVLVPHALLLLDSLNRLQNFTVPPLPF